MYSYWSEGNWDAYIWYWTGEPDPNYQLSVFTSDQCGDLSDGCWSNSEYDQLFAEQQPMVDPDERQAVVHEMQKIVYDENPSIALAYPSNIEAYRNDLVQNFTPVPGDDGYLIPNYNNVGMVTVEPVTGDAAGSTSSSGLPAVAWAGIAAAVVAAAAFFYYRGKRTDDEEG
jgi:peptide/nickel transport system substrate-binding protein